MNKFLLLIALTVISFTCDAQKKVIEKGNILWNGYQLTWKDFRPATNIKKNLPAYTYCEIAADLKKDNTTGEYSLYVKAYFIKSQSMVLTKSRNDMFLLKHEQTIFDIAELFARKIRKAVSEQTYKTPQDFKKITDKIFKQYKKEYHDYLFLYDKETMHGISTSKEKEWQEKIANEMDEYSDYSNQSVIVSFG